jgi:deoxycytidine triphosphate deaminase
VVVAVAGVPGLHVPEAAVLQLHDDAAVVGVDALGEPGQAVDEVGVVDPRHPRRRTAALAADDGGALTDQAGARGGGRPDPRTSGRSVVREPVPAGQRTSETWEPASLAAGFSSVPPVHSGMDPTQFVDSIVHEPTQTEGPGLDVTVAAVHRVESPGRVDFGGGELEQAAIEPVETRKRNADDDYEWWQLDAGQYILEYNESLTVPEDVALVLQTRDAVRARGAFHPTIHVDSLEAVPLSVGGGLLLKQNARVSTLLAP